MLLRARTLLALFALSAAGLIVAVPGVAAANPSCGPPYDFNDKTSGSDADYSAQVFASWYPSSDVTGGVRAPIQSRRDGRECDPGKGSYAFGAAVWIGIQGQGSNGTLAQGGFIRQYDHHDGNDEVQFCKFDQVYPQIQVDLYACGSAAGNDVYVYFEVLRQGGYDNIYDCGQANPNYTFSSCTEKNAMTVNPTDFAEASAENNSRSCYTEIMGSSGDADNVGTAANPMGVYDGGSWGTAPFSFDRTPGSKTCTQSDGTYDEIGHIAQQGALSFYDSRNTS